MLSAVASVVMPWRTFVTGAWVFFVILYTLNFLTPRQQTQPGSNDGQPTKHSPSAEGKERDTPDTTPESSADAQVQSPPVVPKLKLYRESDLARIVACLKADSSILVVGFEGSGKSLLVTEVVSQLKAEDYMVIKLELATPKNMLKHMAEQLMLNDPQNVDQPQKSLSADQLKIEIAHYLATNYSGNDKAFLVIDDADKCDPRFRDWLKILNRQGVPMFLSATDPPRTDIFLNIPRIELEPLADYYIREIMEQKAIDRKVNLLPHQLANIQQRAGGNPMLAQRIIDEEYVGVEAEAGDHHQYFDGTPVILLMGIIFVASRFLAHGFHNPTLYVISGIGSAIFMGVSRLSYSLPKESKRIKR